MKRRLILLLTLLLPLGAAAQGTVEDLTTDFRGRINLGVDKKIKKGLHLEAEFESRFKDNFATPSRLSGTVGISYKVNSYLKVGGSYTFMENYKGSKSTWYPCHRVTLSVTGGYKVGDWRFSLNERLQATHLTEPINTCQEPRNVLYLKSRLKVAYKGSRVIEPYAYVDARLLLNGASASATWSTSSLAYSNYSFEGYTSVYFNRLRGSIGADWNVSRHHVLTLYLLADYCYDKDIDVSSEHDTLKSLTYSQAFNTTIGLGYTFKF